MVVAASVCGTIEALTRARGRAGADRKQIPASRTNLGQNMGVAEQNLYESGNRQRWSSRRSLRSPHVYLFLMQDSAPADSRRRWWNGPIQLPTACFRTSQNLADLAVNHERSHARCGSTALRESAPSSIMIGFDSAPRMTPCSGSACVSTGSEPIITYKWKTPGLYVKLRIINNLPTCRRRTSRR
jgi:hypothetical protein